MASSSVPIIDAHTDILDKILNEGAVFYRRNKGIHTDLPRLRKGHVALAFFAICVDPKITVNDLKNSVYVRTFRSLVSGKKNGLHLVRGYSDIGVGENRIGVIMHMEGAKPIKNLSDLRDMHALGLRSVGITWNEQNQFGTGINGDKGRGITPAGINLIRECNRLGILLDVSHLNQKSFHDVMKYSKKPIIASHSCCHALSRHPRNLTDKQIKAIAKNKGVVCVSLNALFLKNRKLKPGERIPCADPETSIKDVLRHIRHIEKLVGLDFIGIGSDYDGGPVPLELSDASKYQDLVKALLGRYKREDVEKICHKNLLRVIEANLAG